MLTVVLQIWAGLFYLLNKIFFAFSERSLFKGKKPLSNYWRKRSWLVYIIGLPDWVIIFVLENNWIAAALELSGLPAMVLGLLNASQARKNTKTLNIIALLAICLGIGYSLYDFQGLNAVTQYLELGIVSGFLVGTYLLARDKLSGYLWFMLMNLSNAILMQIQDYPFLFAQQVISLVIVFYAYGIRRLVNKKAKLKSKGTID